MRPTLLPPWLLLALAIVTEVMGTLCLRASEGFTQPLAAFGVLAGYAVSLPLFARAIRGGIALGVAYGTLTACGLAAAAVLSTLLYDEPLRPVQILGLVVIVAGVLTLTRRRVPVTS